MRLVVEEDARDEASEARHWYRERSRSAAARFDSQLRATYRRIRENPGQFPTDEDGFQRALLGNFPYAVVFRVWDGVAIAIALAHLSREPRYWRTRFRD